MCLADFGLSSVVDADVLRWTSLKSMTHVGGTVRWTAPEVIEADGLPQPSFESDLYSLASVMFEVSALLKRRASASALIIYSYIGVHRSSSLL